MIRSTLVFKGVDDALAEIDRRVKAMTDAIGATLEEFGQVTVQEMKDTHTFQNRTWRLENSIGYTLAANVTYLFTLGVFASAPYASQVEFGHPGPPPARPYPFFWPVWYRWEPKLWPVLQDVVERTLAGERV